MAEEPIRIDEELAQRFAYHPPLTREVAEMHERIRELLGHTAQLLNAYLPDSREKSLALTATQETMMWANAAVAIHQPKPEEE